jgi:hypothetical protein
LEGNKTMTKLPVRISLPPYLRYHEGRDHTLHFRFEPPTRDRKAGFPGCLSLGTDVNVAIRKVENDLLPRLRAFRIGGTAIAIPSGPVAGTIDELIVVYMSDRTSTFFTNNSERSQKQIRYYLRRGADHIFRNGPNAGMRFGSLRIDELSPRDGRRFRVEFENVEETDAETGETVVRERFRTAKLIFEAFKTMFFSMKGLHDDVPSDNPLANLRFGRHETEEIYAASLEDLLHMMATAEMMAGSSIATMCFVAYDLKIRVESIGSRLMVEHYKPVDRPDQMLITHWKTKQKRWIHLRDRDGYPLYEALEARLDACKGGRSTGILIPRDGTPDQPWGNPDGSLSSAFYDRFHEISTVAGLHPDCTFTSFRHGGITEAAEAGCTEAEVMILSGHLEPSTVHGYIKKTRSRREKARLKVLADREAELVRMKRRNGGRKLPDASDRIAKPR